MHHRKSQNNTGISHFILPLWAGCQRLLKLRRRGQKRQRLLNPNEEALETSHLVNSPTRPLGKGYCLSLAQGETRAPRNENVCYPSEKEMGPGVIYLSPGVWGSWIPSSPPSLPSSLISSYLPSFLPPSHPQILIYSRLKGYTSEQNQHYSRPCWGQAQEQRQTLLSTFLVHCQPVFLIPGLLT